MDKFKSYVGSVLTVTNAGGADKPIDCTKSTKVTINGVGARLSDIQLGDEVAVAGRPAQVVTVNRKVDPVNAKAAPEPVEDDDELDGELEDELDLEPDQVDEEEKPHRKPKKKHR